MKHERKIGFLAALEPPRRPGRARPSRAAASELSIEDARLDGVTVTFDFSTWGLVLRDVHGVAALAARGGGAGLVVRGAGAGPGAFSFDVRGAEARGGGRLRILEGRGAFALPFSHARLDRVATTAEAPDAIQLDASEVTTGRSVLTLAGAFDGVYGVSPASKTPGMTLAARFEDAADAAVALTHSAGLGKTPGLGPGARLAARFDGPFARLRLATTLDSPALGRLDADATLEGRGIPAGWPSTGSLSARSCRCRSRRSRAGSWTAASAAGSISAAPCRSTSCRCSSPGPRAPRGRGSCASAPAAAGRSAPPGRRGGASICRGCATPRGRSSCRAPASGCSAVASRRAGASRSGTRARSAGWTRQSSISRSAATGSPSTSCWGFSFVEGRVTVRARVRGPLRDFAVRLDLPGHQALEVLGERLGLPSRVDLGFADDTISLDRVRLAGPEGSAFEASGRVAVTGRLGLRVGVRDFPVARLPGLLQTRLPLAGRISGDLRLAGNPGAPSISGRLALERVTFQGRPVGGGALEITPGARGAIRARGRILEGIDADGVLSPGAAGLSGEATLVLDKLRLDPFLAALPAGITAAGILSGRLVARVGPGRPAVAEGRLSALTLVVTPPPRAGRALPPIELHAEGDIPLAAQTGDGPIAIGPARFGSSFGAFTLFGQSRGDDQRGTLRGRIDVGTFAPLAAPWFDRLAGALDVDLAATRTGAAGRLSVEGSVAIAAPLTLRPAAFPVDARVPSGRILLRGTTVETTALPVSVRAEHLAGGLVRRVSGDVRLDARVVGLGAAPSTRARVAVDRLAVDVPALGPRPLLCERGVVTADSRGDRLELTGVNLPVRGEARGIVTGGTHVDDATFAVRLQGDPRRRFFLSGDVQLLAVRTGTKAATAPTKPPSGGGASPGPIPWTRRPEIENTTLDLRLRSRGGAVAVDVPHVPDLRVDVDMHVGGTVKRPLVSGEPKGANIYSSFVLALRRLFR